MNTTDLENRKDALERELEKREAKKTNSERQARHVTRSGHAKDVAEDRDDEREPAWGDDGERSERGGSASRRQAARITRGASRRGDS